MNIKKSLTKGFARMAVLALGVGALATATVSHAAADPDLVSALASTSNMVSDNKSSIMTFFVAVGLVVVCQT